MNKIPFSAYDFFGYLFSGFIVIATIDYVFNFSLVIENNISIYHGTLLTALSYIIGHILATPSSLLIEKLIVGNILKKPSVLLLQEKQRGFFPFVFPDYYQPLPKHTRNTIISKAKSAGIETPDESLFYHVFSKVKDLERPSIRINNFLNLYGFSRNVSFAAILSCLIIILKGISNGYSEFLFSLFIFMSYGMFLRYLKFYKLYAKEIYLTFIGKGE